MSHYGNYLILMAGSMAARDKNEKSKRKDESLHSQKN